MAYAAVPDELFLLTEELERLGGGDARVGEIEVVVRVSPSSNTVIGGGDGGVQVQTNGKRIMLVDEETDSLHEATATLGERATEDDVFEIVGEPAVEWFWDGFNASIIANGESGSGKTFTLHGNNFGLCGMILASIFHRRQTYEDPTAITLALSCWECRGEELVDLLADQDSYKMPSKHATQFDFITLHAADLRSALDILKTSRRNSVNWEALKSNDNNNNDNDHSDISISALPNKAHGFIRIVLHNALDMRASTLHIVDCIGEDTSTSSASLRSTNIMRNNNNRNYGNNNDKTTKKQNAIIAKQLLSFRRLIDELCSHKRNNGGRNEYNQGSGVLTSSRETLLNKFISPLIAGNCKSFLLLTLPSLVSNISRSRNILKSYCAASGIRCACVRLLDVQLQDLHFQSPSMPQQNFRNSSPSRRRSSNKSVLNSSQKHPLQNQIIRVPTQLSPTSPKPVWSPSGNTTKGNRSGKKLNSPIPQNKLDFSNGIVPVVKKIVQHNRMLYGEAEDHTMKLFQRMDRQGKGYLSALDLKRGMKMIGLILTNEQVEQLIVEMDDNGDGMIQPEELSAAIHEGGRNPKIANVAKSRSIPSHKVGKSPTGKTRMSNRKKCLPPSKKKAKSVSPSKNGHNDGHLESWEKNIAHVLRMAMEHRRSLYGHTIRDTHTLFESLDRDGSGFLSPDEVRDGLHRLGLNFSDQDFELLMHHVHFDENCDGEIAYEEFAKLLHGVRKFKKPKVKSRLGNDVLKTLKHKSSGKKLKRKKKKSPKRKNKSRFPNDSIRPDVAAFSDKVLKMEIERQNKLPSTPKMNERSIVYDDDPPNISKLKREINGIMNDLMGPEGALKSPPYSKADSMESPSLSNIAEMPIEFQQDEEEGVGTKTVNLVDKDVSVRNVNNNLKTPLPRQTYDSLPGTNSKPVGASTFDFQQEIEASFSNSNLRSFEQKYYTLLERLKDERDLNGRLKRRTDELQNELLQRSNSYELEIDNYKIEKIEMKRRIRHLQKESSYPDMFDEYERQIKKLTDDLSDTKKKCNELEAARITLEVTSNLKSNSNTNNDSTSNAQNKDITGLKQRLSVLQKQVDMYKEKQTEATTQQDKLEESKRNVRLMGIKVVDLERYLRDAEKDRDSFMKRVAALEGENKALRENEDVLLSERKVTADEMHAMRLYVSDVDKEKRRNDLLSRFVRKHTSDMAPPPPPELESIQRSLRNAMNNLKKQLLIGLPRSVSNFSRVEKELNNLSVEIDRLRIREQDLLDALRNVVEENEANQMGGNVAGIDGNQSYASRRNMEMANSLIIDPEELNDDDDSFIPNGSSISNINGDINDKKAMLEAQRKELTESIIEGL